MATRKNGVTKHEPEPEPDSLKKSLLKKGALTALKMTGSAALGGVVAITEIEGGEKLAKGVTAGAVLLGAACEIFADPIENPYIAEAGKITLASATGVAGYKKTKKSYGENKRKREEKKHDATIAQLKKDMAKPTLGEVKTNGKLEAPKETVPIAARKRQRRLAKPTEQDDQEEVAHQHAAATEG